MRYLPLVLLVAVAGTVRAQAPVITPQGDPSLNSDTIYRLAVNPADYPDEPYVYLLDDGVERFEADGHSVVTYRQVVQVLKQEAVEDFAEFQFSFSAGREKLTINWIRVVRPDGTIISGAPTQEQESDAPVTLEAPTYSDLRRHRATLAGVAPGTIVDWSYTIERLQPFMPGDFHTSWRVNNGRLTRRSRFIVDVPESLAPRIQETNLHFARQTTVAHGRRVYAWVTKDVPKNPEAEPFARDTDDVYEGVAVGSPRSWDDVARWYEGLVSDRYALTPELEAKLTEVVGSQRTREDSLRALYRWVAQDFRYVSVSLGIGGFQPHFPAEVFRNGYGDCKDKATLFIALARRMGWEAYPVLLDADAAIDSTLPSPGLFDHMIAAVVRPQGYLFLDLTSTTVPVGLFPASEHGGFALIVHPDGRGERLMLPLDSVSENRSGYLVAGELSPEGIFAGTLTLTFQGTWQLDTRADLTTDVTAVQRANITRTLAGRVYDGATGDSLALFDGRDLQAPTRISLAIRDAKATSHAGTSDVLTLPIRPTVSSATVAEVAAHMPRHYHIDARQVFGAGTDVSEIRMRLPEGWKARLPDNVNVSSVFGSYSASYTQEGRDLHVVRRTVGARGLYAPDRANDLLAALRAVAKDDARYIIIEHP
jgi:Domain of Unknown Function with PDB structure (DUF3857)/Transglutaminase-like superfamily